MFSETVLVTALPTGSDGRSATLSALLSPRLQWGPGDFRQTEALSALPSIFRQWIPRAQEAEQAKWTVLCLDGSGRVLKRMAARVAPAVDRGVGEAILGRKLAVRSWAFPEDVVKRPILTLPLADLEDWIFERYSDAAPHGVGGPLPAAVLADALDDLRQAELSQGERGALLAGRAREAANDRREKAERLTKAEQAAVKVHERLVQRNPDAAMLAWARALLDPRTPKNSRPPEVPSFELHEILGLLSDHPALQRALGLVVDLRIEGVPRGTAQVRVEAPHLDKAKVVSLRTAVTKRFRPQPKDPVHALSETGFLKLDDPRFEVLQVEVEQALLALSAQAEASGSRATDTLPALSSRGLAVAWTGRAEAMTARLDRAAALQDALRQGDKAPLLWAEDLVTGYAIDVAPAKDGAWRSLCRRQGGYTDARGQVILAKVQDELPVQDTVDDVDAEVGGAELSAAVTNERLFQWSGWSLAVPKPGKPMDVEGAGPGDPDTSAPLGVRPRLSAPNGSLPMLRFGQSYRFRARVVDLAGNAVPHDSDDDTHATAPFSWQRYLPLMPPVRVFSGEPGPGAGRQRLVARTTDLDQPDQPDVQQSQPRTLWLGPVRAGVDQVEAHGVLDPSDGADAGARFAHARTTFQLLTKREGAVPAQLGPQDGLDLDAILADPLSQGAWIEADGGAPLPTHPFAFDWVDDARPWPDVEAAAIRLQPLPRGAAPTAAWDPAARVLTIGLEPAGVAHYRLRAKGPISNLGLYGALANARPEHWQVLDWVNHLAANGHAMLDPKEPLALVHAVRLPLDPPGLVATSRRQVAATAVLLDGHFVQHVPSTGQVQLLAAWQDVEHAPDTAEGYTLVDRSTVVGTWGVEADLQADGVKLPPARLELGDTRYRPVTFTPRAFTRFRDCFAPDDGPLHRDGAGLERKALSSRRPEAPDLVDVVPIFRWEESTLGTARSKQRVAGLRVHLRGPWFSSGIGEQLGVIVRSSGSPSEAAAAAMSHVGRDPTEPEGTLGRRELHRSQVHEADGDVAVGLALPDGAPGDRVGVVGVHPSWDRERQLWTADVRLELGTVAFPFVQLALARYQPDSLPGLELSPIVRAGFRQLAPDRLAVLVPQGGGAWYLTVRAVDPRGAAEARGRETFVLVQVEHRVDRPQVEAGWQAVASSQSSQAPSAPVRVVASAVGDPRALWAGTVHLSDDLDPALHRVVVREVQRVGPTHRVVGFTSFVLG